MAVPDANGDAAGGVEAAGSVEPTGSVEPAGSRAGTGRPTGRATTSDGAAEDRTTPTAQVGRRRLDRRQRRTLLVEAAVGVLADRDPGEVALDEIAAAAGVSRALVYNYFGDRHGLVDAVRDHCLAQLHAEIAATVRADADSATSWRAAIAAVARAHLCFARRDAVRYRFALAAAEDPRRRAVSAARLGGGTAADLVARGANSALGAMILGVLEHDRVSPDDIDADEAVHVIASMLWHGLADVDRLGVVPAQPVVRAGAELVGLGLVADDGTLGRPEGPA
jgi:AcrR family transcriptional regulator